MLDAENSQSLLLEGGFPWSLDELVQGIKRQCNLNYTFRLQFMGTNVEELKEKGTIKVIQIESSQCHEASLSHSGVQPLLSPNSASVSSGSQMTQIFCPLRILQAQEHHGPSVFLCPSFLMIQSWNLTEAILRTKMMEPHSFLIQNLNQIFFRPWCKKWSNTNFTAVARNSRLW